jgi:LysM repeat protein
MYRVYFDGVQFPVAPSKMKLVVGNRNETINLMDLGEVNVLKSPTLTDISFNLLIPHREYPFTSYPDGFRQPEEYFDLLERLKLDDKPFRFIMSRLRPLFDTNMLVSLEDYEIDEDVENGLDMVVSIQLKQYKPYETKTFEIVSQAPETIKAKEVPTRPAKEPARTYTVKAGDTLWAIAKKQLGDGSKFPEIAKANDIGNPDLIQIGQELTLNV